MKYIISIISIICLFGCGENQKSITHYYKAIKEDKIVSYQQRNYIYTSNGIEENILTFNTDGAIIEKSRSRFKKHPNGLDIIINGKNQPYLRLSEKSSCVEYKHPMSYNIKNCYEKKIDYKGNKNAIRYTCSEEITDGLSMVIYLRGDYTLIDKLEIIGIGNYDKILKTDKDSIPNKIKEKL